MRISDWSSDVCSSDLGEGVLAQRSVGVTDWDSKAPVDADTRYKVGSVSKVFTALAIQVAARQGLVSLDQPLRQRLADPPWHNRWQATRPIKIGRASYRERVCKNV